MTVTARVVEIWRWLLRKHGVILCWGLVSISLEKLYYSDLIIRENMKYNLSKNWINWELFLMVVLCSAETLIILNLTWRPKTANFNSIVVTFLLHFTSPLILFLWLMLKELSSKSLTSTCYPGGITKRGRICNTFKPLSTKHVQIGFLILISF